MHAQVINRTFSRSAHSQRNVKSTNSSSGSSRIPIKRNSSLRAKRSSYKSGTDEDEEPPQSLLIEDEPQRLVLSQAEFDDMPIPAARGSFKSELDEQQPPMVEAKVVQRRPFLQVVLVALQKFASVFWEPIHLYLSVAAEKFSK